jgi:hypothetical protein
MMSLFAGVMAERSSEDARRDSTVGPTTGSGVIRTSLGIDFAMS